MNQDILISLYGELRKGIDWSIIVLKDNLLSPLKQCHNISLYLKDGKSELILIKREKRGLEIGTGIDRVREKLGLEIELI